MIVTKWKAALAALSALKMRLLMTHVFHYRHISLLMKNNHPFHIVRNNENTDGKKSKALV